MGIGWDGDERLEDGDDDGRDGDGEYSGVAAAVVALKLLRTETKAGDCVICEKHEEKKRFLSFPLPPPRPLTLHCHGVRDRNCRNIGTGKNQLHAAQQVSVLGLDSTELSFGPLGTLPME